MNIIKIYAQYNTKLHHRKVHEWLLELQTIIKKQKLMNNLNFDLFLYFTERLYKYRIKTRCMRYR